MNSSGQRIRTLPLILALFKVMPETLKSSDRTKARLRAALLNCAASPSRRDTSWPF